VRFPIIASRFLRLRPNYVVAVDAAAVVVVVVVVVV
jgi:hypothetical protein